MSILIVDDSEDIRLLLKSILKTTGYNDLLFAKSANEAYEVLGVGKEAQLDAESRNVDLILMDVAMPGTDGIEACSLIKENENLCDIPVVMVTALDEIKLLEVALDKGALDYIAKPFNKIELLARIRSALRLKKEIERRKARERELEKLAEELKKANERLKLISALDGLTGIANRRAFDERIAMEWVRALRHAEPLSIIMIDIDYFKLYNDTYGHQAGDECLKRVAKALTATLHRAGDMVARYGGEEFAIILPETDLKGALHLADEMRARVESLAIRHEKNVGSVGRGVVTISLGVATLIPHSQSTPERLVSLADKALYMAKEEGRNRVKTALRQEENI